MIPVKQTNTLAIAGIHCAGIAGLLADLKTFAALTCNGLGVPTLTVAPDENFMLVVTPLPQHIIQQQLQMALNNYKIAAVKIGLLTDAATNSMIAAELKKAKSKNIVLDLVLLRKTGEPWLSDASLTALINDLMPLAAIVTPNLEEAEFLLQTKLETPEQVEQACKDISSMGPESVIIKDLPLGDQQIRDCLYLAPSNKIIWLKKPTLEAKKVLGAGCTLASAIAAFLSHGHPMPVAVTKARDYVQEAIAAGLTYYEGGTTLGHNALHHFYSWW